MSRERRFSDLLRGALQRLFLPARLRRSRFVRQLLTIDAINHAITTVRYRFARARGALRVHPGAPGVADNAIAHNVAGLRQAGGDRSHRLLRPLLCIDRVRREVRRLDALSVGPRTESELIHLVGYGFRAHRIRGLDLISYSPWVDLGDMHAMPYEDSSFDVVLLGWVLGYSEDRESAAREVIRVARDGAVIAVGNSYNPAGNQEIVDRLGYLPGGAKRIQSIHEILGFFGEAVDTVYFCHDVPPRDRDKHGSLVAVFSIRKPVSADASS